MTKLGTMPNYDCNQTAVVTHPKQAQNRHQPVCGNGSTAEQIRRDGCFAPASRDVPVPSADGTVTLTFREFFERMSQVANSQLPCIVSVAHAAFERWYQGPIHRITHSDGRLEVSGESFAIYLREGNLGTITLVNYIDADLDNPVLELHNRANQLVARIHSLAETEANTQWRQIMIGPSGAMPPV